MIATSPVHNEPPPNLQLAPIEVHHQRQPDIAAISSVGVTAPPWKALSDFALQTELDQPPFQHLVSSFGESSGDEDDDTVVCLEEPSRVRRSRVSAATMASLKPFTSAATLFFHQSPPLPPPMTRCIAATAVFDMQQSSNGRCSVLAAIGQKDNC
jgi:hypothetical protein